MGVCGTFLKATRVVAEKPHSVCLIINVTPDTVSRVRPMINLKKLFDTS